MSRQIQAGSTNQSVVIRIIDSTDGTPENGVTSATSGLDLEYRREGAVSTDITESDLSALTDAHSDGGMLHIGNGYYRLDLPDAAVADGVTGVLVHGTATGMVVIGEYVELVDYNPYDGVRLGLTALPNAAADAAGGLLISDGGGQDIDTKLGYLTGNVALASVVGALTDAAADGDPTTGETLMQYIKQLINILVGTAGVVTFPAEAAPANAVSLAEVIRAIHADVTGLNGDTMRGTDSAYTGDVTTQLNSYDAPTYDELLGFVQLLARSDAAITTDRNTELSAINTDEGSGAGDYAATTDSLEALQAENDTTQNDIATAQADLDTLTGTDGATLATSQPNYAPAKATALTTHDGKLDTVDGIVDNILLDTAEIGAAGAGLTEAGGTGDQLTAIPWNASWDAEVQSEVTDALNAYDPPTRAELTTDTNSILSKLLKYVQLMLRSDSAIATDNATELTAINADGGSGGGDYANTTESNEALRDYIGDGSNLTEAGGDGDHLTAINLPNQTMDITGNLSGSVGSVTGAINTAAGTITTLDGLDTAQDGQHAQTQTDISNLNNLSAAEVNTEVVDALNVDTYSEPGQENPASTQTIRKMIQYLYKAWRNRSTQTATQYSLYADDGTTLDQKSTVSDDGTTFDSGEKGTGP